MHPDPSNGRRSCGKAWAKVFCLYCCCAFAVTSARGAVVVADIDGDGWLAFDANFGVPWTTSLIDINNNVWGSGQPVSGLGVAFSGPATQGQFGLFDDHIAESTDLVTNLGSLSAAFITFSFYQDSLAYSPNALSVFFRDFQSDDWYRNITPPTTTGWTSYTVDLSVFGGWFSPTGGSDFALALSGGATQQMGLHLQYGAGVTVEQRYGLANYQVLNNETLPEGFVPEPSTTALFIFGGIAIWATRRRWLTTGLPR